VVWTFSLPYDIIKYQLGRNRKVSTPFYMRLYKYDENQLRTAVKESYSMRQVLIRLGVQPYGGNYDVLRKAIKHFSLDTSHFHGQGWAKGKTFTVRDTKEYLENKYPISSHKLRKRLLKENYFEHLCQQCGLSEWNKKTIPLELHHIDGNKMNNNLSNLTIICPNCHSQSDNFRGKNKHI